MIRPRRRLTAVIGVILALTGAVLDVRGAAGSSHGAGEEIATMERAVVERVNEIRGKHGARPLDVDEALADIARDHSCRMARGGFFAHDAPGAGGIADRLRAAGKDFRAVGENLATNRNARDPVAAALSGWMKSPSHRRNILSEAYTETGVGICRGERGYYVTQVFVKPA